MSADDPLHDRLPYRLRRTHPTAMPPLHRDGPRAHIGWATLRAAFDAHRCDDHHDRIVLGCGTCTAYAAAVTTAHNREHRAEPQQPWGPE